MHRLLRVAALWLPPLLMMALIFALSAMPGDDVDRGLAYLLARKLAHLLAYALLLGLWWRALRTRLPLGKAVGVALAISVAYAVSDELHQLSVDGRIGTPRDVAIDTAGAAGAAALILRQGSRAPA
jgi:VanZ family protein